jgi:hypothetical protein
MSYGLRRVSNTFLSESSTSGWPLGIIGRFDWFVIGEKGKPREKARQRTRLSRILLYEIKMRP